MHLGMAWLPDKIEKDCMGQISFPSFQVQKREPCLFCLCHNVEPPHLKGNLINVTL